MKDKRLGDAPIFLCFMFYYPLIVKSDEYTEVTEKITCFRSEKITIAIVIDTKSLKKDLDVFLCDRNIIGSPSAIFENLRQFS